MDVEIGKHPQSFCYVMSVNANQRVMQLCVIQQCVMCCGPGSRIFNVLNINVR